MSTLHWFDFECDKDKTLRTLDFIPKCQLWWCRIVDGGDTTGAVHLFQTMERIQQMDGRNRNIKWKYVSAHKAIICQSKTNKIAIIMESKENISTLMWEWELLPLALSPLAAWPTPHWCRGKCKVTISKFQMMFSSPEGVNNLFAVKFYNVAQLAVRWGFADCE